MKVDNSQQLLIGKSVSRTASVNTLDSANASFLVDGEIVVLDENDQVMAAGTTYAQSRYIRIVQRSGATASTAQVVQSARIDGANVIQFRGLTYSAPQEQISYIGYDGAAGSIDDTQTTDYVLRVTMKHNKDVWSQTPNTSISRFTPNSTTNQTDIIDSFATDLSANAYLTEQVSIERLSDNAGVAEVPTATAAKGSKSVTLTATSATIVAGIYLRMDGGATTDAVYKIASITGTDVTLDQPYQGTSGSGKVLESITAALGDASNMGLKFTGLEQSFDVLKFHYVKVKFEFQLSGFGTSTVNYSQASLPGSGVYEQISELEQRSIVYEGAVDRANPSAPTGRADAVSGQVYDIVSLEYFNNYSIGVIDGARPARASLFLALVDGAAQTTNVLAALNPWLGSAPGNFANVAV